MNLSELSNPFPADDIEWRVQRDGMRDGKIWAIVLAYVTNRAIMDRLDNVVGIENWTNEYKPGPAGGVLCGISIKLDSGWVTKWDGADNTDIEGVKGGLSGSMKRAAVQWGIGRYLYHLEATFANVHDGGKYRGVHKDQKTDKKTAYKWDPPALPEWALPEGEAPKKEEKKHKDPKRQYIIDDIVEVLKDPVFYQEDREAFKQVLPELKTYQQLHDYLDAVQKDRDKRKETAKDLDAQAEKAWQAQEPERSEAESKLPGLEAFF